MANLRSIFNILLFRVRLSNTFPVWAIVPKEDAVSSTSSKSFFINLIFRGLSGPEGGCHLRLPNKLFKCQVSKCSRLTFPSRCRRDAFILDCQAPKYPGLYWTRHRSKKNYCRPGSLTSTGLYSTVPLLTFLNPPFQVDRIN